MAAPIVFFSGAHFRRKFFRTSLHNLRLLLVLLINVQMSTAAILIDYYCSEGHFHFTNGGRKLTNAQITTKMSLALSTMLIGNALSNMW